MNIQFENKLPHIDVGLLTKSNQYRKLRFLIDTGFNGAVVFITNKNEFLKVFRVTDLCLLAEQRWVKMADGRKKETFYGVAEFQFDGEQEDMEILIIDSEKYENPILGIDFLKQNRKQLLLDFMGERFSLT